MRLVFSDLDGTFLTREKQVTPVNAAALDLLDERGVGFVPCTGRPLTGISPDLLAHPCVSYAICANGASVVDVATGEHLHRSLMGPERVRWLYERVASRDITFDLFADDKVWAERARYDRIGEFVADPWFAESIRRMRTPTDLTIPEVLGQVRHVERLGIYWKDPADRDAVISLVESDPTLSWVSSAPANIEISDATTSKGSAMRWLCAHLGVGLADVVAFGDSSNDASMIEVAGDGVAMANAMPEAKAVADHVTADDNDASGVGRYLEEILDED